MHDQFIYDGIPFDLHISTEDRFEDFLSELQRLELISYARIVSFRLFKTCDFDQLAVDQKNALIIECEPLIFESTLQVRLSQ